MGPADTGRLQDVFRRESRSLLQYARESAPYATGADRKILAEVQRIAEEESTALGGFAEFLNTQRVPIPYLGSFPMVFTDLNFVAIRFLVPKLVTAQRLDLASLESGVESLTDPLGQGAVRTLVDLHRRHLKELEGAVSV